MEAPSPPVSLVELSASPLDLLRYVHAVADDGAGAVATFVGVTRNSFEGRAVVRLQYEAYEPMVRVSVCWGRGRGAHVAQALQELRSVVARARERWQLCGVALAHRTGVVPVGEASVVVAVSSPHRREALDAVSFCIDDLKAHVPIWKKELDEDAGGEWKANVPQRRLATDCDTT